jgi:hypothetical protein
LLIFQAGREKNLKSTRNTGLIAQFRARRMERDGIPGAFCPDLTGRSPLSTLPLTDLQYFQSEESDY